MPGARRFELDPALRLTFAVTASAARAAAGVGRLVNLTGAAAAHGLANLLAAGRAAQAPT